MWKREREREWGKGRCNAFHSIFICLQYSLRYMIERGEYMRTFGDIIYSFNFYYVALSIFYIAVCFTLIPISFSRIIENEFFISHVSALCNGWEKLLQLSSFCVFFWLQFILFFPPRRINFEIGWRIFFQHTDISQIQSVAEVIYCCTEIWLKS